VYWCDVHIREPSNNNPSYVELAATQPGHALKLGEQMKLSVWSKQKERGGVDCQIIPMVFETSGRMGKSLIEFIYRIATDITETSQEMEAITSPLWTRLSVTLQKCNVRMIDEANRKARGIEPNRNFCWLNRRSATGSASRRLLT
jgi:hypothetical protein